MLHLLLTITPLSFLTVSYILELCGILSKFSELDFTSNLWSPISSVFIDNLSESFL